MKTRRMLWPLAAAITFHLVTLVDSDTYAQEKPDTTAAGCRIEHVNYKGWQAEQVSNPWVKLIFVPQNGGRLMQVIFDGHPYLFVSQNYAGKYFPPSSNQWFNYGGDKLWVLPEGSQDEKHWVGNSDILDDGLFAFQILKEAPRCEISLTGPADPQTGLQFRRIVALEADSPRISFHAVVKNASGHPIEWSVQSVSQYDASDAKEPSHHNRNIWGFTRTNPSSSYLNRYHVRFGPAENSAAQVREDGIFALHYVPLAAELWLDSKDGWLAVVDGESRYAMVERFRYEDTKQYPGRASVIFWTNGPALRQHADGTTTFGFPEKEAPAIYMEAELNSPMVRLEPGEGFTFDTQWLPTRGDAEFRGVTDAGVVLKPLRAVKEASGGKVKLAGAFGVFFPGKLVAHFYDTRGVALGKQILTQVDPKNPVLLQTAADDPGQSSRISLHLEDTNGQDRGALGEVEVEFATENH